MAAATASGERTSLPARHDFPRAGRLRRLDTRKRIFRRGKLLDHSPQPLGGTASSEPVGNVVALLYLRPKLCQVEHAQATRNTVQVCRNEHDMLASGLVIVSTNDDVGAFQRLVEFGPPLAGAHRVAGRCDAVLTQRDDVFLAFDHEDGAARGQLFDQLVQAKQDDPHALDRPLFLIRSLALAELLRSMQWLEAKHLKQQRATLVGVNVGLLDRTEIAATVAFTRFRTIPPAAMTKPRGALAVDLYVEIAAAAGRTFGCVLARARRDVCNAVPLQQFLRREGHDRASPVHCLLCSNRVATAVCVLCVGSHGK